MSKKIAITVLWISTILLVESMNAQPYRHGAGEFSVPGKPNSKIKYTNDISITDGVDANGNPVQYLGIWLYFENDINSNEEYDVIVCAMLQFENEKISPANYPYICQHEKKFAIIKERYLDNEGNPIIINGKSGSWKCIEIEVPTNQPVGTKQSSLHFGCQKVHIGKSGTGRRKVPVFDIVGLEIPKIRCITVKDIMGELVIDTIYVSRLTLREDNDLDSWHIKDWYIDILRADDCDYEECSNLNGGFNISLAPIAPSGSTDTDYKNIWAAILCNIRRPIDNLPFSIGTVEVGNWVTMEYLDNYPSRFIGKLYGAPSGSLLTITYPKDTIGDEFAITYDSISYTVDTLSACVGDTLNVDFPFMVTPFMGATMKVKFEMPSTICGNSIQNGSLVQLLGNVTSRGGTVAYDIGEFMYSVNVPFLYDTTRPIIGYLNTLIINDSTVRIKIKGSEDECMVVSGWIVYQVNGGPERMFYPRYEDSLLADGHTNFFDTLRLNTDSATITFKAIIQNSLGLLDTSWVDTCVVYAFPPLSSSYKTINLVKELSIRCIPNPADALIRFEYNITSGERAFLKIYNSKGQEVLSITDIITTNNNGSIIIPVDKLPHGLYHYSLSTLHENVSGSVFIQHP